MAALQATADRVRHEKMAADLQFYTPAQIAAMTSIEPPWVVRGYAAREAITEIDGKIKTAGKTTLTLDLVRAVTLGYSWLGQPTTKTKVVYVTESQRGPFRAALDRAGLHTSDDVTVLFRRDFNGIPWDLIVETVAARAKAFGANLVVFDTIAKLAGIKEENASGEWMDAMAPLQNIAHDGLAVILCRHSRKGTADVGEAGRGNSAASGDVDIILDLRRPEGNHDAHPTRRVLESLSRYDDTPEKSVIDMTDDGYVLLGTDEAVSMADAIRFVTAELADAQQPLTQDELVGLGKEADPPVGRSSIQRALKEGERAMTITHSGAGKRGDPKRFSLVTSVPGKAHPRPTSEALRASLAVVR